MQPHSYSRAKRVGRARRLLAASALASGDAVSQDIVFSLTHDQSHCKTRPPSLAKTLNKRLCLIRDDSRNVLGLKTLGRETLSNTLEDACRAVRVYRMNYSVTHQGEELALMVNKEFAQCNFSKKKLNPIKEIGLVSRNKKKHVPNFIVSFVVGHAERLCFDRSVSLVKLFVSPL
jgi:hypothetical protein